MTLGEVSRRLDQALREINRRLDDMSHRLDQRVVGLDYYTARHEALSDRVTDLERTADSAAAFRKNMLVGLVVAGVTTFGNVIATIVLQVSHK